MTSFNVAGLLHEPPGTTRDARLKDHYVTLGPDVELAGPLNAVLRFQRTNRGILVRGEVDASLRRTCSRCTDPFVEDVRVELDEEFLPSLDPSTGAPVIGEDDLDTTPRIDAHNEIELDRVLHDELSLTEPMHPLCRHDCPGLCPTCGEKLDRGEHTHEAAEIDPRLAGLAALLGKSDGERP
ncbi:MAG TPA: DUF177 domain-containing protein [Candidatus Limnocylindria bacterium]